MRLLWATDVHLNFLSVAEREVFYAALGDARPDRVVLTGDVADGLTVSNVLREMAAALGVPIDVVLGNHDYYRSDVSTMRAELQGLSLREPRVRWLHGLAATDLGARAALVGVDGWGDARLGHHATTPVLLNDFIHIGDLLGRSGAGLTARLRALGDDSAAALAGPLREALGQRAEVIVATHVPPFREACWHEGGVSDDDWLPYFTCKAVGDALLAAADAHPHRRITVLCGHTHSGGECSPRANLRVLTGGARYGHPAAQQVFEID